MSKSAISNIRSSIFLYGPSGSGKSTVGKILAESLNIAFIDLDLEIETQSGVPIPEIFAIEGESGFREREHQALQKTFTSQEKVVALGGGALTIPRNRELAEANGQVILLKAPSEILLSRLQDDSIERPLLSPSPPNNLPMGEGEPAEDKLNALLEQRGEHYASFPAQIETDGKSPTEIAWEIQVALGVFISKGMESRKHPAYDVRVQSDGLGALGEMLLARGLRGPVAVVTDENVGGHYLAIATAALANAGFETCEVTIPAGEEQKNLETITQLWGAFSAAKIEIGRASCRERV